MQPTTLPFQKESERIKGISTICRSSLSLSLSRKTENEKRPKGSSQYYNTNIINIQFEYSQVYRIVSYSYRVIAIKNRDNVSEAIETATNCYKSARVSYIKLFLSRSEEFQVTSNTREDIFNFTINFRGHQTACNFSCFAVSLSDQKKSVNESWHELVAEQLCLRCNQMAAR